MSMLLCYLAYNSVLMWHALSRLPRVILYIASRVTIIVVHMISKNIYGFMNSVCNINNNLVRSTVFGTIYMRNSMWQKWILQLYTFTRS